MDRLLDAFEWPLLHAAVAFGCAGAAVALYGLVLQPAWFPAGGIPTVPPPVEVLVGRTVAGTVAGGVLGVAVWAVRTLWPASWSVYGVFAGLILAGLVQIEIVSNPAFPVPWIPGLDGDSLADRSSVLGSLFAWTLRGGWLTLFLGAVFGLVLGAWHDGAYSLRRASQSSAHGPW